MKRLTTAAEVIDALGGDPSVAKLTKASSSTIWNWRAYFEAFPPNTYVVMQEALARRDLSAPPHLWKMRGVAKAKRAA